MLRKSPLALALLFIADLASLCAAFLLGYFIRFKLWGFLPGHVPSFSEFLGASVFIVVVWIAILKLFGLYEMERGDRRLRINPHWIGRGIKNF